MAFDTSVLDAALAERREQWEQDRQALLADALRLLIGLAGQFDLRHAYLFGSLVQPGRFTEASDVDMAVAGLPADQFFALSAVLSAALGRDVDLVMLERCHFADKIRREGLLWTAPD
jgi:uncharacterized protein